MESIFTVRALLPQNCFMVSLDLRDAYLHVPIAEGSQEFLRLAIDLGTSVVHLQFQALPFGLSSSPRVFTKVLAEPIAFLRLQGVGIIAYLDDLLLFAASPEQVSRDLELTKKTLMDLGWLLNLEKSSLIPSQRIPYLGYTLDSTLLRVFLPLEKALKLEKSVSALQGSHQVSIRFLMSTLGLLTSTLPAVQWAGIHFRALQAFVLRIWDHSSEHLDVLVQVPSQVKRSLWWWRKITNLSQGRLWHIRSPLIVTTDASGRGWGAHLGVLPAQGVWEVAELKHSSNWKELRAIGLALIFFQERLRGHHVQVRSDNASAVAYVNKQGGTRCVALSAITTRIFRWAETNTLSLSAVFLRGIENSTADFLSRSQLREDEWSLNQEVFHLLVKRWGSPEIDLFASRENAKTHWFFLSGQGRGSKRDRCPIPELAIRDLLRLPTPSSSTTGPEKISAGEHLTYPCGTPLAQEGLVFGSQATDHRTPSFSSSSRGSPLAGSSSMPTGTQVEPCGVVTEESLLRSRGFSDKLTATLLNSRKKETRSIYRKVWLRFNTWCQEFSFPTQSHKSVSPVRSG
ncbi:uncharacterized protein LOC120929266 [Rana temporaria]|uniref:uncharacterized protein LOC120929266 n=1 Tax=Rana temporaria TaxID=8407 RepID=UPI001AAC8557|nr:uncharacterized protein LOC120929266 [Rana temporaria]